MSTRIGGGDPDLKPKMTVGDGANEESLCFALGLYRSRISANPSEYVSETGENTATEEGKISQSENGLNANKFDLNMFRGLVNEVQSRQSTLTRELNRSNEEPIKNDFLQSQINKMGASAAFNPHTPCYISASSRKSSCESQEEESDFENHLIASKTCEIDMNSSTPYSEQPNFGCIPSSNSVATISTHEIRLPMYLPNFKPATGCTNASDFTVRCFAARLRAGITVVKHGRSRWCKSRLRILHVHSDGRSLTWKPAPGEPTSKSKPPKLDLSTCMEVRHAGSPDPLFPMFTGTPILRHKCEATNAHKSFALIFPKRTVDITALTADQCKVLMEGFSALCFRLQVANLAHSKGKVTNSTQKSSNLNDEEEDIRSTTESNTLTNNSIIDSRPLRSNYV